MKFYNNMPIINGRPYEYVYYPEHHLSQVDGTVAVHILVAEDMLGRELQKGMVIHHIDENKKNNLPENIMVFINQKAHMCYHMCLRYNSDYELRRLDGVYYCEKLGGRKRKKNIDKQNIRVKIEYYCPICGTQKNRNNKVCITCYNKKKHELSNCPQKDVLYDALLRNPNFTMVAKIFGVSDNAVRKWCKFYKLPSSTRDWKKLSNMKGNDYHEETKT